MIVLQKSQDNQIIQNTIHWKSTAGHPYEIIS